MDEVRSHRETVLLCYPATPIPGARFSAIEGGHRLHTGPSSELDITGAPRLQISVVARLLISQLREGQMNGTQLLRCSS